MKYRSVQILVFILMLTPISYGKEAKCEPLNAIRGSSSGICQCGPEISKLNIKSPYKGLELYAVCDYQKIGSEITGGFHFKGRYIANGEIRREEISVLGDHLTFSGPQITATAPFYDEGVHLRLTGEKAYYESKAPAISEKRPCWFATATIIINDLHILIDGGTDMMGSYPAKFKIMKIGEYKECAPSESP